MTAPAVSARHLACSLLLGAALGVYYEFLRPLRPRHTRMADGLYLLGAVWAWLFLSFRVCRGDLRLGYTAGLAVGAAVWEWAFGPGLRPVFSGFWKMIRTILGAFFFPVKKFWKFTKNYLHLRKNGLQ